MPSSGLSEPRQDLQQRGLARAVAPDQADALAGFQGEIGVVEQGHMAEGQLGGEDMMGHEGRDYPAAAKNAHSDGATGTIQLLHELARQYILRAPAPGQRLGGPAAFPLQWPMPCSP